MKTVLSAFLLLLGSIASSASAATLYDGSAADSFRTGRSADAGLAGQFSVSAAVDLTQFGMGMDLNSDGNINFVIFEGTSLIYQSGAVAATDVGYSEFLSPLLAVTLNPGSSYFIGALTDMGSDFGCCGTGGTQGVVTSISANSNPTDFDSPTYSGVAGAHVDVNLYGDLATPAVPLPASLPLLGAALLGFGVLRRRKG